MLKQDGAKVSEFDALYLNMFPSQNSETIRLEEAHTWIISDPKRGYEIGDCQRGFG